MAELHPQLSKDCLIIGHFSLSRLLLMQDANYPWLILVPDRENISELYQLSDAEQKQFMQESAVIARLLKNDFQADKINIAALGNIVPQLHIHHIARYKTDIAWPAPVWGKFPAKRYTPDQRDELMAKLKASLNNINNDMAHFEFEI